MCVRRVLMWNQGAKTNVCACHVFMCACMNDEERKQTSCVCRVCMCACMKNQKWEQKCECLVYSSVQVCNVYITVTVTVTVTVHEQVYVRRVLKCTCMQSWLRPQCVHVCTYQNQGMKTNVYARRAFVCPCMKNQEWKQMYVFVVCACVHEWNTQQAVYSCVHGWEPRYESKRVFVSCHAAFMCARMNNQAWQQKWVSVMYSCVHVWTTRNDNKSDQCHVFMCARVNNQEWQQKWVIVMYSCVHVWTTRNDNRSLHS